MGFLLGKTYELKDEWKSYFDLHETINGKAVRGFYWVKPIRFTVQHSNMKFAFCQLYNDKGEVNPLYAARSVIINFDWVISLELNIYHIFISRGRILETFGGAIVLAASPEEARTLHPDGKTIIPSPEQHGWTNDPELICVEYLGRYEGTKTQPCVELSSFWNG